MYNIYRWFIILIHCRGIMVKQRVTHGEFPWKTLGFPEATWLIGDTPWELRPLNLLVYRQFSVVKNGCHWMPSRPKLGNCQVGGNQWDANSPESSTPKMDWSKFATMSHPVLPYGATSTVPYFWPYFVVISPEPQALHIGLIYGRYLQ